MAKIEAHPALPDVAFAKQGGEGLAQFGTGIES